MLDRVDRVDVAIAGAGPTGLTLACALLERGVSVRVFDAAAEPATTLAGVGFTASRGRSTRSHRCSGGVLPSVR